MKGVLLAGFRGERMRPLSSIRPKQLLPILHRTGIKIQAKPVIDYLAERMYRAGVRNFAVVVSHETEVLY